MGRTKRVLAGMLPLLSAALLIAQPGTSSAATFHAATHKLQANPRSSLDASPVRANIVGGEDADVGAYPWMAFIEFSPISGTGTDSCSGTIIASNVILTAGHCVIDESTGAAFSASSYRVITGNVDRTDPTATVSTVSRTIVYPGYNRDIYDGDAALLILTQPISAPAIPLADSGALSPGTGVVMAGWGQIYDGSDAPDILQWAPTAVQSSSYCEAHSANYDPTAELCVTDPPDFDTAACFGDSGGPLLYEDSAGTVLEAGITSHGPFDCDTDLPNVYTNLVPLFPWIHSEVAANPPTAAAPTTTPTTTTTSVPITTTTPTTTSSPTLPELMGAKAKSFVRATLASLFPDARRHNLKQACTRESSSRFTCGVTWWSGKDDYWGEVSIWWVRAEGQVEWTDHYSLKRANNWCYFDSGDRSSCKVTRMQGE